MKSNTKSSIVWIVAIVYMLFPTNTFAQGPTLVELVNKALEKNYDLANQELAISSEQETHKSIKESYLPRLEANGKYAHLSGDLLVDLPSSTLPLLNIPIFDGNTKFNTSANLWSADLTASMLLYSGNKVPKLSKAMEQKIKGQTLLLEKDRQEIIDQVSQAYDQLALLTQATVVLEESEKRLEIEKRTANKAFEYGLITAFEKNKIDVAQATLEAKQQELQGKRTLLISQLSQMTNFSNEELALINVDLKPYVLPSLNENAEGRPEFAALEAAVQANQFKIDAEKTHWIPKVQAMASAKYLNLSDAKLGTPYKNPSNGTPIELRANKVEAFPTYFVGIGFKWDIFDGFTGKRAVNKAKIELQQTQNNQKKVKELLNLNLEKAKIEVVVSGKQLKTGETRKLMAEKALDIAAKEYKIGLIKPSDRIMAENDYQVATLDYIQSIFNQRRASFNYLKATGTLTLDKL